MVNNRHDASTEARRLLSLDPVIIDTETTGLLETDEICELAAVSALGDILVNTLVKPTCPVSHGARAQHRITDQELSCAPPIDKVIGHLHDVCSGRVVLTYNAEFDFRLLRQSLKAADYKIFDASLAAHGCIMLLHDLFNERMKLEVAVERYGIKVEGKAHRALPDARAALALLQHMARPA